MRPRNYPAATKFREKLRQNSENSHLQRLSTEPGERILLIIGAGHVPLLRFIAQHSPEYEGVEAGKYLGRE